MPRPITPRFGDIGNYSKSVAQLEEEGVFAKRLLTLLQMRHLYWNPNSGFRDSVHSDKGKGEWSADVIDSDNGTKCSGGYVEYRWIQRPKQLVETGSLSKDDRILKQYKPVGGKVVTYRCPLDGWEIPYNGEPWDLETGAAVATTVDKRKAIELWAKFFSENWQHFGRWGKPTPEGLAACELSYHMGPKAKMGHKAVQRVNKGGDGFFGVKLYGDIAIPLPDVGSRVIKNGSLRKI